MPEDARHDGGVEQGGDTCAGGSERSEGWVCIGCGKHVTGSIPVDVCSDCGGEWFEATPERLACDRCRHPDASRVLGSEFNRLCWACVAWNNRKEETAEEIASNYGEMVEFGRAVKLLESAAAELRRNGHATCGALEACDGVKENLNVLFQEYDEMRKFREKEARNNDLSTTGSDRHD